MDTIETHQLEATTGGAWGFAPAYYPAPRWASPPCHVPVHPQFMQPGWGWGYPAPARWSMFGRPWR
jgi:hypothetical protein